MYLYCLKILPTIPLCNMIPSVLAEFCLFTGIYFSLVLLQAFRFYAHKRTQNSFTTIRYVVVVLFILIFISIVISTEAVIQIFFKIGVLKNFANFTGKHLCWSEACNSIKKRFQHGCFPVKFVKFLRTPFFTEHFR